MRAFVSRFSLASVVSLASLVAVGVLSACQSAGPRAPASASAPNETLITVEDHSGAPYELEEILIGVDGALAYRWNTGSGAPTVHRVIEPGLHIVSAKVTMRMRCGFTREPHGSYTLHASKSVRVDRRTATLTLTLFARDLVSQPKERLGLAFRGEGMLINAPYAVLPAVADLCAPLPLEERVECRVRAASDLARQQRDLPRLECADGKRRALEDLKAARPPDFGARLERIDRDLGACICELPAEGDVWEETARCAEDPDARR